MKKKITVTNMGFYHYSSFKLSALSSWQAGSSCSQLNTYFIYLAMLHLTLHPVCWVHPAPQISMQQSFSIRWGSYFPQAKKQEIWWHCSVSRRQQRVIQKSKQLPSSSRQMGRNYWNPVMSGVFCMKITVSMKGSDLHPMQIGAAPWKSRNHTPIWSV